MFSKTLIKTLKDLKSPEILLYISFEALFIAVYTWSLIGIKDAGYDTWVIMAASALRNGIAAAIVFITTQKMSHFLSDSLLIKMLIFITSISCFLLVLNGYNGHGTFMMLLLISLVHSGAFSLRLLGTSILLPKAHSGEGKNIKLAIVMVLGPILLAVATTISGLLADIDMNLPVLLSAITYLCFIFITKYRKAINNLKDSVPLHGFKKTCRSCWVLILMVGILNSFSLVIKWVIIPLYLWDELGHDPTKLGIALSLITLLGLVSKTIKDDANEHKASPQKFILGGYFITILAFSIWSFTDSLILTGLMIALKTVGEAVYSYGVFGKLESLSPKNYQTNVRLHLTVSYGLTGVAFFAAIFWADLIMNNVSFSLMALSILMALFVILYQVFYLKFEKKTLFSNG